MRLRGVSYDVGRVLDGMNWRPAFDPAETRRELAIIRDDLHCNAVRICGADIGRVVSVAADALDLGLHVWLSPELWDHDATETLEYVAAAARQAESVREQWPDRVTFSVGSELTLFMKGFLDGDSFRERLAHPALIDRLRSGAHNEPLNAFLARATAAARQSFRGPISYASLTSEHIDWTRFDVVGVDLYREAANRDRYARELRRYLSYGRPLVISEFGCCTFRGAADLGPRGWEIVDFSTLPPKLKGDYVRDEGEQAREVADLLATFTEAGLDGAFVFGFVQPLNPYSEDPRYDLDMAAYSLVKSFGSRLGDVASLLPELPWDTTRMGSTYPGLPWEPKESFRAVAQAYR
jgi:hypothetical protein